MNARNVPTTNGKSTWTSTTLRDTLISPRQAGLCRYKGEIVGEAKWPAIIAPDVWHSVHRILTDPARRTNHVGAAVQWLGSGIYSCGVCGSKDVRVYTTGDGRKRYRCRNRVKGDPVVHVGRDARLLDAYVERVIVARLSDKKLLDRIAKRLAPKVDVVALRDELAECRRALQEASEDRAHGLIDRSQLVSITQIVRARIHAIESDLASGGTQNPLAQFTTAEDVAALWYGPNGPDGDRQQGLSLGVRREVLRLLAEVTILPAPMGPAPGGVYFKEDCIDVSWRIDLP